ncbi:MAG: YjbH domain-containing protein [Gammaproteobacteria bacterium]
MKYIFKSYLIIIFLFHIEIQGDSFKYNTYNNHGVIGLINMPTARFYDEQSHGLTIYDGTPDQKMTFTSSPYNWMEASIFYTNIQGTPYPGFEYQDYKDKGFNLKLKLKEQDNFPAIAIGLMDFAGTGLYSSEYIVTSYGINNIDMHIGLGWGTLNGSKDSIKNPLGYISNNFKNRPTETEGEGGQFQPSRYFSGQTASPFFGASYALNRKTVLKIEKDSTLTTGSLDYKKAKSSYSFGIDYSFNDNFVFGFSFERGSFASLKFIYKNNPKTSYQKYEYQYQEKTNDSKNKYQNLITNLERNGVGVNKIIETTNSIGLELTQFTHPNLQLVEEIIQQAKRESGINKNIKKNLKTVSLNAITEFDDNFEQNSDLIYERQKKSQFNTKTRLKLRPFLASREEFFKGALLLENDSEYVFYDNLLFNINLKYSLADNFDDLRYPPINTFPAQVRSDVKQYLKNMDKGLLIGRAQIDYFISPYKDHHLMFTGGILEDMFSGFGFEYLYFKNNSNYSLGFEMFSVKKRDYNWGFGTLDYKNLTGHLNLHYRNYGLLPFDMKLSYGEYLAGDIGTTIEFSRTYENGLNFGIFASFTDVTTAQFGEGSFDKGIYFNIPIYGNLINYSWRPLTKDPGAKLTRRNSLHSLLVKFRPIN